MLADYVGLVAELGVQKWIYLIFFCYGLLQHVIQVPSPPF
jgi:hypothetical protein